MEELGEWTRTDVACGNCRHFRRDRVNPEQGAGTCAVRAWSRSLPPHYFGPGRGTAPMWPETERRCAEFVA